MIIAILVAVAIVGGLSFGLVGELFGLSPSMRSGSVGAVVGIAAAFLIARRRAAVSEQKGEKIK